ncbi:hypothetical protein [Nitrosococcus oceani]|uniref:Uncharacterized protein n=1 Tax=Nitrosococcus oceani C-27 TaxID=314279 RepID=A0A0E2ZM64_9GAMM|nr:hypothetical protein [Nitrosococcus oceani]EDZ68503.1 hypothetical protein NOC27_1830 [Nitrosococcus oceani AFC27]KFI19447.1 hypothetical protein IB75_08720 [Nitrosococcus oceani C-27]KFI22692.1 hypothetical protein HW44_07905 [Nitrosococcus oceani]GEM21289.1 hypothetical protein NONS58_27250 [Nitrosococcus oceani]
MKFSWFKIFLTFTGLLMFMNFLNVQADVSSLNVNVKTKDCSVAQLAGRWVLSESGTHVAFGAVPFSQIGWFLLKKDGTGKGEAFLSVNGQPLPPIPLEIHSIKIKPKTCVGKMEFFAGGELRTITFILNAHFQEIQYISTTGDITTLGNARRNK